MANDKNDGRIILDDHHYISVGDLSYDLVAHRVGRDKNGKDKVYEKTLGYYTTVKGALKAYIRCDMTEQLRGKEVSLSEFLRLLAAEEQQLDRLLCKVSPSEL